MNFVPVVVLQDEHPAVPETAVIGFPHDIKGEGESERTPELHLVSMETLILPVSRTKCKKE